MKKLLAVVLVLIIGVFGLASCANSHSTEEDMLDKLHRIKSDWTDQQVLDLLGEPDRLGERSVVREIFYTIPPASEAAIAFWDEGIEITVTNHETGEKTVILDVDVGG